MKNHLSFLLLSLLSIAAYGQQKPPGYYSSVLSSYEYRGWKIRKGDRVALNDGDTIAVKEIQKYGDNGPVAYYVVGKNKTGNTVYYEISGSVRNGVLKTPGDIPLDGPEKLVYGNLPVVNNRVVYEQTGEAPALSKDVLYDNALSHLAGIYANSREAIRVQDKELGHIIVAGGYSLSYGSALALDGAKEIQVSYLCEIQVKEGKYRVRLYDFELLLVSVNQKRESYPVYLAIISNSKAKKDVEFSASFDRSNRNVVEGLVRGLEKAPDTSW